MISEKTINWTFHSLYGSLQKQLKKQHKDHYLNVEQLSNGLRIGDLQIDQTKTGFNILKTSTFIDHTNYSKSAIILTVLLNKKDMDGTIYEQVKILDDKYGRYRNKIQFLQIQRIRFSKKKIWNMVDVHTAKLVNMEYEFQKIKKEINLLYLKYVF